MENDSFLGSVCHRKLPESDVTWISLMLCTSFKAPVEKALRTRDHCTHVCVPGYQSISTSQCSTWNVLIQLFSNLSWLQNHLGSLLKHRLLCPIPEFPIQWVLDGPRFLHFSQVPRLVKAAGLDTTLRSSPLVYLSESLKRIDNFKKCSQLNLPKILHVYNEIILTSDGMDYSQSSWVIEWRQKVLHSGALCIANGGWGKKSYAMLSALAFCQTRMCEVPRNLTDYYFKIGSQVLLPVEALRCFNLFLSFGQRISC